MSETNKLRTITKAVIPAAGKGTRLLPLTKAVPKELIPLGRKPVLEHIVDEVIEAGITEILFVISEEKTAIRSHFGDALERGQVRLHLPGRAEGTSRRDLLRHASSWATIRSRSCSAIQLSIRIRPCYALQAGPGHLQGHRRGRRYRGAKDAHR